MHTTDSPILREAVLKDVFSLLNGEHQIYNTISTKEVQFHTLPFVLDVRIAT